MFNYFKNLFNKPTAKQMARETVEEYQRLLLATENQAAYNAKLAEYYREGISRLNKFKPVELT